MISFYFIVFLSLKSDLYVLVVFFLHESYLNNILGVYLLYTMSSISTYNFLACVRFVFWQCNLGGGLRQTHNMLQGLIYFILPAGSATPKLGNN